MAMDIDEVVAHVESLGGVLSLRPGPGDGSPEIAWGDVFFSYAPDGVLPQGQPFATIVTKDYPDDAGSRLDRPGAFRVNVAAGTDQFVRWTGRQPRDEAREGEPKPGTDDVMFAHPVYGILGWLCVTNPGPRTDDAVRDLLTTAHGLAEARHDRRAST